MFLVFVIVDRHLYVVIEGVQLLTDTDAHLMEESLHVDVQKQRNHCGDDIH